MPKFQVVGGGMAETVAFPSQAQAPNNARAAAHEPQAMGHAASHAATANAGYVPQPPAKPLLSAAYQAPLSEEFALHEPEALVEAKPVQAKPAAQMQRPATHAMPRPAATQPAAAAAEAPKRASLFSRVFGGGSAPAAQVASQRPAHQEPVMSQAGYRQEPAEHHAAEVTVREPARAAVRPTQVDEIGLEIPAFLRRSQ
jgi:cell division protein FtsZ